MSVKSVKNATEQPMNPSEKVSNFFRLYQVKIPAAKVTKHDLAFVTRQVAHLGHLLKATDDDELMTALKDIQREWITIADSLGSRPALNTINARTASSDSSDFRPEPPRQQRLDFYQFVKDNSLSNPNSEFVVSEEDANEKCAALSNAVLNILWSETYSHCSDPSRREVERKILGWVRGYSSQRRRLGAEFGTTVKASKGPSSKQLQKRAEKRQKDQDRRAKMRGKG